ncbi:MAG TPA: TRAP transporter substrate-binding protein DctP [Candidatus Polarisedimenticolia bacterium]|jgi:TRAP-type C4-dicarboxylate transport system substrate-binding protein
MTRRIVFAAIVAATLACGLALPAGVAAAQTAPPVIKLGTGAPNGSSWHQILKTMGERWRQAPGGGVTLRIYAGGVLGDEPDLVRKMRVGQIQAAALTAVGMADIDPAVSALQIPLMFRSYEELDHVREKIRPMLEKRLDERGFMVLNWGDAGWVMFFAKEPFARPDDLKRMKLFAWAGDNNAVDLWKELGFHPVALSSTDILPGLQTGLINAFDTTPLLALSSQWFGLAPHMLDLKWSPLVGATIITKKAWESIPATAREEVAAAAAEAGERFRGEVRASDAKAIETMKKHGLIVRAAGPELEAEWLRAVENVYPRIRGTLVPAEIFDEVRRLRDAYRTAGGAPGE